MLKLGSAGQRKAGGQVEACGKEGSEDPDPGLVLESLQSLLPSSSPQALVMPSCLCVFRPRLVAALFVPVLGTPLALVGSSNLILSIVLD